MFDVWIGDIELIRAVLFLFGVVLLLIQLLLCFKGKNKVVRLLPAVLLSIVTIFFIVMAATATDWENLGYIFPVIFIGFLWFMCGMAWGIWAIIKFIKKKKYFIEALPGLMCLRSRRLNRKNRRWKKK